MNFFLVLIFMALSNTILANCEKGEVATGYMRPVKEIQMYTKPSKSSKKVLNEKASSAFGKAELRTVNSDYELTVLCVMKDWVKGSITKVDGDFVNWETGWIQRDGVSLTITSTMESRTPAKNRNECISKGIEYYKKIGSYPYLSTGKNAEDSAKSKCDNTIGAFN